jgi:anti-anti-sigma factor
MSSFVSPRMEVSRTEGQTIVRLVECRSITEGNAELLGTELDELINKTPTQHLILDVQSVDFISSVGLGKLIGIHGRLRKGGGRLTLRNPRPMVREILAVTCLDQVLDIDPPR